MARMSIDDSALRDARIRRLARTLREQLGDSVRDWPDFERRYALGTLLDVWAVCYDRESDTLPPRDIDTAALIEGFFAELVAEDLAHDTHDGIYVRGARKRIAYLHLKEEAGRTGGNKSARLRRENVRRQTIAQAKSKHTLKHTTNPPDTLPDSPPLPDSRIGSGTEPQDLTGGSGKGARDGAGPRSSTAPQDLVNQGSGSGRTQANHTDKTERARAREIAAHELSRAIAGIEVAFAAKRRGAKPTWSGKQREGVARLVRLHGADEVLARAGIVWGDNPPRWPETWDVSTLVQHFDKAESPGAGRRDVRYGRVEPSTGKDWAPPPPDWNKRTHKPRWEAEDERQASEPPPWEDKT